MMANQIKIKTPEELDVLRIAGKTLSDIVAEVVCSLKTNMTTQEIDLEAEKLIAKHKVIPAFKGYRGFPACTCISVNQEVVHGIPSLKRVKNGDLVSIDIGLIYNDYFSDMAITVPVGQISAERQKLMDVTRQSLLKGIEQARVGNHLSDISHAVEQHAKAHNFSVVRDFVGHGIGRNLHEEPEIPNYGPPHCGPVLEEGMVFAIEPMVNIGSWETKITDNGWTVETLDGTCSAHFEHTVAITKNGPEILTQ